MNINAYAKEIVGINGTRESPVRFDIDRPHKNTARLYINKMVRKGGAAKKGGTQGHCAKGHTKGAHLLEG